MTFLERFCSVSSALRLLRFGQLVSWVKVFLFVNLTIGLLSLSPCGLAEQVNRSCSAV